MSRALAAARLIGPASYVPEALLTNAMLAELRPEWTAEKISQKVGIDTRHMAAPDEFTSDMAVAAAERLFEQTGVDRESVDFIVLMTCTPDYLMPITAGLVQHRLGIPRSAGALDSTHACTGFLYGVGLATSLVESGRARRVLLLTADRCTTYTNDGDVSVRTLMGDGATASFVERAEGDAGHLAARVDDWQTGTDGEGAMHLCVPTSGVRGMEGAETTETRRPVFTMNAPEIFNFAVGTVVPSVREFVTGCGLELDDIDLFIFHQSSMFLLQHIRRSLKLPEERFSVFLRDVGSTSSSAIPMALEAAVAEGRVAPGKKVVLVGFGAGLSWSSMLLDYGG